MMLGELVGEFFSYFKFLLTYFGLGLVLENLIYELQITCFFELNVSFEMPLCDDRASN